MTAVFELFHVVCAIQLVALFDNFFPRNFPLAVVALFIVSRLDTVLCALTIFSSFTFELIKYLARAHRFTEGTDMQFSCIQNSLLAKQ